MKKKIIPVFIMVILLLSIISINAFAGTNQLSFEFRGSGSKRSLVGKSTSGTSTIVATPNYTTTRNGYTVAAMMIDADPNTPYEDVTVSFEWWTDTLISTRKSYIVLYEGQMGWPSAHQARDLLFGFDSSVYTTNNNYSGDGHWTFKNARVNNGIYSKFKVTMTGWSTND